MKIESSWQPSFEETGRGLAETTFIVIDLETTGAAPTNGNGITEIGAVKVRGGELIGEFSTFVNPGIALPDYITSLTGITDQMLSGAPTITEIFPSFMEFLGPHSENYLVAHNAPFDMGFITLRDHRRESGSVPKTGTSAKAEIYLVTAIRFGASKSATLAARVNGSMG